MKGKNTSWILWGIAFVFLSFFIAKALCVPITHDESGTCLYYSTLSIKQIVLFDYGIPWPSNHVLNTLSVKFSKCLFGLSQFTGRLPNLLTAILFLVFVIKMSKLLSSSFIISLCIFLLFLANPYMNDFFSLARGYGMALAFMAGALYYLLRLIKELSIKNLSFIFLFGFLTVAANFTFLIFIASLSVIVFIIAFKGLREKKTELNYFLKFTTILFFSNVVIALFSYLPVTRMASTDQFQFWGQGSFYSETFLPMYHHLMYGKVYIRGQHHALPYLILLLISGAFIWGLMLFFRKRSEEILSRKYFSFSTVLLLVTVLINFLQHTFLGTPYLNGRTALLYLPLTALMFGTGLVVLSEYWKKTNFAAVAAVLFIALHLINTANLRFFREWWYDENTLTILNSLEKVSKVNPAVRLNTHWLFNPSFEFYKQTKDLKWLELVPYHKEPQLEKHDEFYYTVAEEYKLVPPAYNRIMQFDDGVNARALFYYPVPEK